MSFLDVIFKWHCQLNQVYSIVLFVVKDHVRLELRNNDVNWEGTSSIRVSADVTKQGEVVVCRLNETFQSSEHVFKNIVMAPGIFTLIQGNSAVDCGKNVFQWSKKNHLGHFDWNCLGSQYPIRANTKKYGHFSWMCCINLYSNIANNKSKMHEKRK